MFTHADGIFYRSVLAADLDRALDGSIQPGRYSRANQKTLYLSASREGVAAALMAHARPGDPERRVVAVKVAADLIFDLHDDLACRQADIDRDQAFADWQRLVAEGQTPPSWAVADRVRALGANGLIDPSRHAPGLWHMVLFRWNVPGGAKVRLV